MKLKDCTNFANENKVCYLATTEGDQPRVRGFLMWYADETGFYFHTSGTKEVCKQLKANPKVEVCFIQEEGNYPSKMMRLTGEIEFFEDDGKKQKLFEERAFLEHIEQAYPTIVKMFRIYKGEAYFWTMADNLKEAQLQRIKF